MSGMGSGQDVLGSMSGQTTSSSSSSSSSTQDHSSMTGMTGMDMGSSSSSSSISGMTGMNMSNMNMSSSMNMNMSTAAMANLIQQYMSTHASSFDVYNSDHWNRSDITAIVALCLSILSLLIVLYICHNAPIKQYTLHDILALPFPYRRLRTSSDDDEENDEVSAHKRNNPKRRSQRRGQRQGEFMINAEHHIESTNENHHTIAFIPSSSTASSASQSETIKRNSNEIKANKSGTNCCADTGYDSDENSDIGVEQQRGSHYRSTDVDDLRVDFHNFNETPSEQHNNGGDVKGHRRANTNITDTAK